MKQPTFDNASAAAKTIDQDNSTSSVDYLEYAQKAVKATEDCGDLFIAADEKMTRIREIIKQIKNADVPVLITGESGTGKEVIANAIHTASNRKDKPFVAVNCAALPSNLLESELFGYEKGAFTGAHQRHIGKFEQANGGTLLLDEVTEMDPSLQAKLLRALQEKEVERIGGSGPISIDTRIVATTNRDIVSSVAQGKFRQDLYYRLHVMHLEVPPLRDRLKDVELLSDFFLRQYAKQFNKADVELSSSAKGKLYNHSWPGNVRELQNVIQRAVLLTPNNQIGVEDIPIEDSKNADNTEWTKYMPIGRALKDLETQFILATLKHHRGNRTHASRTLGISLRTLRNKINEYTAEGLEVTAPAGGRN